MYNDYVKNVKEKMKSRRKTSSRSAAGHPSVRKPVQSTQPLMSIVTEFERKGWPTPWRQSYHTQHNGFNL